MNAPHRPFTWAVSEDGLSLQLLRKGQIEAEVHRWTCDRTHETVFWCTYVTGQERGVRATLSEACAHACECLGVTCAPPSDLLAEHGEQATSASSPPAPATLRDAISAACFDPRAAGYRGTRTTDEWRADAVMAVLRDLGVIPGEGGR